MSKTDGGPITGHPGPYAHLGGKGLTIRDYFAGQALAGALSDSDTLAAFHEIAGVQGIDDAAAIAGFCYEHADAMLEARDR